MPQRLFLLLILLSYSTLCAKDSLERAGDLGQFAIPLSAGIFSLVNEDPEGVWQLVRATGVTLGITYALKYSCNTPRPNGGKHSFPSGHSASAFVGAAYLDRRYGIRYGLPAYVAATFVGYSRIEAKAHRPVDVVGAAMIAYFSNYFLTSRWSCTPFIEEKSIALSLQSRF